MPQINIPKTFPQKFSKYCLEIIIKKFVQLTCIVIGLQLPNDGSILSGIAIVKIEEALFVNIDRQKMRKREYTSLFKKYYKQFSSKLTTYCNVMPCPGKVKPLQSGAIDVAYLKLFGNKYNNNCFFYLHW